jgi:hypothetical protein
VQSLLLLPLLPHHSSLTRLRHFFLDLKQDLGREDLLSRRIGGMRRLQREGSR